MLGIVGLPSTGVGGVVGSGANGLRTCVDPETVEPRLCLDLALGAGGDEDGDEKSNPGSKP